MIRRWGDDGFDYVGGRLFELVGAADLAHVEALPGAAVHRDEHDGVTVTFDHGDLVVTAELIERANTGGSQMEQDGLHVLGLEVRSRVRSR